MTPHAPGAILLGRTEQGSATLCPCCDRVELVLGNARIAAAPDDLRALLEVVDSFAPMEVSGGVADRRCYVISVADNGSGFAFADEELAELRSLLSQALREVIRRGVKAAGPRFGAAYEFLH